ncbi:MAG: chorismate synthase [Bacteroidales bacterium]|nr:chorismate synthase [Candidatus Colimorpha onthohippi]
MNTIGNRLRFTSFGESHGVAVGGVLDGFPSGVSINFDFVKSELGRRRGAAEKGSTTRQETDEVEWLSGLLDGVTLGTPIAFALHNIDCRSVDYDMLRSCYRPGHADYTYQARYGVRDFRGGGRASARETAARVVAGALSKQWLMEQRGISVVSSYRLGGSQTGNVGGVVSCTIQGVRAGVGSPVFGKLNALLSAAEMTIPSAIGFEMGAGFESIHMSGKQFADAWEQRSDVATVGTVTNHCGGIQGGISNGMPIEFRVAFHPVTTQPDGMDCLTDKGEIQRVVSGGRHDLCQVPRACVIVEAMAAMVLMDCLL